ncbi:MAG: S4 domain-containing protein [Bacteroidota bacterium]
MLEAESQRIDKWLWAVRLFKTRANASEACRTGRVKLKGEPVKASRDVHVGEVYVVKTEIMTKTILVKTLLKTRVGAKFVPTYLEDLTPPEEFERLLLKKEMNYEKRDRGSGRPTKKERRDIEKLKED